MANGERVIKVDVTKDDIRSGNQRDCASCPVTLALCRCLGRNDIWVYSGTFFVGEFDCNEIALPVKAKEFIVKYDTSSRPKTFKPFTFEITIPEGV